MTHQIPVIDVSALRRTDGNCKPLARQIGEACRRQGFFYIVGHGVDPGLIEHLESLSQQFFAQDIEVKQRIRMELAGQAWRGFFPVGSELTSGQPDQKEGIYFGSELDQDHKKVRTGVPLHGRNLFPDIPGFRETILQYMDQLTAVGHRLMRGIAISLDLDGDYFRRTLTADPILLFRIFHYPPLANGQADQWGVGEHTDYGLLTILKQDSVGGLQVKSRGHWIDAPPLADSFVCNIGDMLDLMTGGLYLSTPHRVRNNSGRERYSFPFFFDPGWDAEIGPIRAGNRNGAASAQRWDGADLRQLRGTYGQYLMDKIAKVFPNLADRSLRQA